MKKMMFACLMLMVLAMTATGAHAITPAPVWNYDQTLNFSSGPLTSGQFQDMIFAGIKSGSFTVAFLELTFSNVSDMKIGKIVFPVYGGVVVNETLLNDFRPTNGVNLFALNPTQLNLLNSVVTAGGIPLSFALSHGTVTLNSARLYGTVAPEPATLALMGAGLAGLPVVRRLRKKASHE